MAKADFFQEVEICNLSHEYFGRKGVVLGISEEGGRVFGYAVLLHGFDLTIYFDCGDVAVTGVTFSKGDFY